MGAEKKRPLFFDVTGAKYEPNHRQVDQRRQRRHRLWFRKRKDMPKHTHKHTKRHGLHLTVHCCSHSIVESECNRETKNPPICCHLFRLPNPKQLTECSAPIVRLRRYCYRCRSYRGASVYRLKWKRLVRTRQAMPFLCHRRDLPCNPHGKVPSLLAMNVCKCLYLDRSWHRDYTSCLAIAMLQRVLPRTKCA